MNRIRAVVFGVRNLLLSVEEGSRSANLHGPSVAEFGRLVRYMRTVGIQPVLFQNDAWVSKTDNKPITEILKAVWGEFPAFVTSVDGMPAKPRAEAMTALLARIG